MILLSACPAHAEVQSFGPFTVDTDHPEVIRLDGDIEEGDPLNFRRALAFAPNARLVVLNSGGGLVSAGLLIADDVHVRGLATLIPSGSQCFSACSFVFLAGVERQADGDLGVHQIRNGANDAVRAQTSISDILDVLDRFDTPIQVLTVMFKTPPDDMYVFSSAEIEKFGINRRRGLGPIAPSVAETSSELGTSSLVESQPDALSLAEIEGSRPSLEGASASRISAIEAYTRRPDRLALYAGLDFFGEDLASSRVADAPACAMKCLSFGDQCKAFTFNTDDRLVRGPNCFLKARRAMADGNAVAISGELLRPSDPSPDTVSLGIIDPKTGIFENVDLPGGDLSRRAHDAASTPQQCRLACVANQQCIAFTFVRRKGECWLKGSVGQPRYMDGMVSGAKSLETYSATLVDLD
ncbi:PAN domain-containing protein [Aureimonas altamirensis]|uniref:PAN domain-containing protein n=1 Tax=Aureimonas altamirensis TaxID=370622 RepID=UPI002036A31C|nr:PAN domain-containing protein [Aureimonas altamirensis]MCM2502395.1 PAN domain-containing protein [Aureimonas altamirensis]